MPSPHIRDRIVELRRVREAELRPHPQNWRLHPSEQRSALSRVLVEIGYADALIARTLPDGGLELIDGHLRAELTPDAEVPVLVVDLDEREAALLLAVHDPLAAMAETNEELLCEVIAKTDVERSRVDRILTAIHGDVAEAAIEPDPPAAETQLHDLFQVVVECRDEAEQRAVFERMTAEGFRCRVSVL